MMASGSDDLTALEALSKDQLRERWQTLTGLAAPRVSPSMLRLALGYELQARRAGGLSRKAQQRLKQAAAKRTETRPAHPGTRLVREHGGVSHVVTIAADGAIVWNGRTWRSLSEVARAITGTRWSGPAFFGLRQKVKAA